MRMALAVSVLLFLLTACGGGSAAGDATLDERAGALAEALEHEDWLDAYRLMHPGFRQTCTQENFLVVMVFAFAQMQQNFTGDSDIPLDWRVEDVVERGDAGEASIVAFQGRSRIEGVAVSPDWVRLDGTWFLDSDPVSGCLPL